jgi:hypothetical protein
MMPAAHDQRHIFENTLDCSCLQFFGDRSVRIANDNHVV